MLEFTRKTTSDMDEDLVFNAAFHKPIQMNLSFEKRVAVMRFAVFASKEAAEKGARQIQDPISIRIEGDKFDRLTAGLLGDSDDIRGMIANALSREDSPNKKEKITWVAKKK